MNERRHHCRGLSAGRDHYRASLSVTHHLQQGVLGAYSYSIFTEHDNNLKKILETGAETHRTVSIPREKYYVLLTYQTSNNDPIKMLLSNFYLNLLN